MFIYSNNLQQEATERTIIPPDKWITLSFDELLEQKNILFDRWEFINKHNPDLAKVFLEGLQKIDILITDKMNER